MPTRLRRRAPLRLDTDIVGTLLINPLAVWTDSIVPRCIYLHYLIQVSLLVLHSDAHLFGLCHALFLVDQLADLHGCVCLRLKHDLVLNLS